MFNLNMSTSDLRPGGTMKKLTAWAGIQNRQELWNVGMSFSLENSSDLEDSQEQLT